MAKLTIIWYDNFGENQTPLQRNGMATITQRKVVFTQPELNLPYFLLYNY